MSRWERDEASENELMDRVNTSDIQPTAYTQARASRQSSALRRPERGRRRRLRACQGSAQRPGRSALSGRGSAVNERNTDLGELEAEGLDVSDLREARELLGRRVGRSEW